MKPIGMDKNGVLVYSGDIVRFGNNEYKAYGSQNSKCVALEPITQTAWGIPMSTYGLTAYKKTESIEVVNVSDRTNHERYFADLCSMGEVFKYICVGTRCHECVVNESLCKCELVFNQWLDRPAVKL